MVLSFKPQYPPKILAGTKIHTIRKDIPNRWKVGNKIHFATGVRTKNYKQFFVGECKSIQKIFIRYLNDEILIYIDDRKLPLLPSQAEQLAVRDGFESLNDFSKWFDREFTGKIIHWTDFKY